jgi:hypothetical protein
MLIRIYRLQAIAAATVLFFSTATSALAQDATLPETTPAVSQQELAAKIEESSSSMRNEISGVEHSVRATRDELESKIEEKAATIQKNVSGLRSTIQISAISTTLVCAACAILAVLILFKITSVAGNVVALLNMPTPSQPSSPLSQGQNPSLVAALSRIEEKLNNLAKANSAKAAPETPAVPREIADRISSIEQTLQHLAAHKENAAAGGSRGPDISNLFWPKSVQSHENFAIWKKQLRDALAADNEQAMMLLSALLDFQTQSTKRDIDAEHYAELVRKLGMAAYAFCYALEKVPEEDRLDIVSALLHAVKDDAQSHAPAIEIRAFVPNDRLNTDTMEKVDPGSRLTVQRPLSWLIVGKNGGKERILHRAMVITG